MMYSRLIKGSFLILLVGTLLAACTIGSPGLEAVQQAVEDFYQARQQQDAEKALTFYSDKRSREEWQAHLAHVTASLGNVETFELKNTEVNTVLSGRFYIFEYRVVYSGGKVARETLTLFDTVESDDVTAIVSHVIAAEGYKPLI